MRRYAWLICFRSLKFPREVSGGRIPCPPNQRLPPETLLECIGMWWTCWILMYIYNYELGSPSPSIMIKPFLNGVKSTIIDRYTYIIEIQFFCWLNPDVCWFSPHLVCSSYEIPWLLVTLLVAFPNFFNLVDSPEMAMVYLAIQNGGLPSGNDSKSLRTWSHGPWKSWK